MFRKQFAVWRHDHLMVAGGHFKNGQPAASERSPMRSLLFRISRAGKHRDVTSIGLRRIATGCSLTKPLVVSTSLFVREGTPQSKP